MLTFLLVWTVALGSLGIFIAGMIFPELSRKNDLIWVGVGLFYALILWVYSGKIGGGLLLGQTAGISMMVWLGWQTMSQRRELTPSDKKTPVPDWLQKIIDIVTPLWEKASTAVTNQLGGTADPESGELPESSNTFSDLKSKALGLLEKLNTKPNSPATIAPPIADQETDLDEDWDEDSEDDTEVQDETILQNTGTPEPPEPLSDDSDTLTAIELSTVEPVLEATTEPVPQVVETEASIADSDRAPMLAEESPNEAEALEEPAQTDAIANETNFAAPETEPSSTVQPIEDIAESEDIPTPVEVPSSETEAIGELDAESTPEIPKANSQESDESHHLDEPHNSEGVYVEEDSNWPPEPSIE